VVRLHTNIKKRSDFSYYCIFGSDNKYATNAIFSYGALDQCPFPYVLEENLLTIEIKI
jgi:hypothetical protein